jgi:hypothetical protein
LAHMEAENDAFVHSATPRGSIQFVYKNAVLKGLKLDLSNAESTTDSWATGPKTTGEPLRTISLYGRLAYFAIVQKSPFGTR